MPNDPVPNDPVPDDPVPDPSGRRRSAAPRGTRTQVVLAVAVTAFALLVVASRTWLDVTVTEPLGGNGRVDVPGTRAAPAVPALALVALASAGALTIARRVGRRVVLTALALAGTGAGAGAGRVLLDPAGAARASVAEATGLTASSVTPDAAAVATTGWPWVTLVVAMLLVVLTVRGAVVARRWPAGHRFDPAGDLHQTGAPDRGRTAVAGPAAGGPQAGATGPAEDRAQDWDALTRGEDPTLRDGPTSRDHSTHEDDQAGSRTQAEPPG